MTISIDDIPVIAPAAPVSNDTVLYASNLAGGDANQNYIAAQQELAQTGASSLVEQERKKWAEEQAIQNKLATEDIISDTTLPIETRRQAMTAYVQGAIPLLDLRAKFLAESAVRDVATSVEDKEAQTVLADSLPTRDDVKQSSALETYSTKAADFLTGFVAPTAVGAVKTTGALGAQVFLSIPAGLAAGFELMRTRDPAKAEEVLKQIQEYAYSPSDELSKQALGNIQSWMETADIPFKWAGEKALEIPLIGGPGLATAVYTAGTTVGYIGAAAGVVKLSQVVRGKPKVAPTTPMDTVETASKEQAGNLAAKAVEDKTGQIAQSVGSSKEEILNTYVLPKIEDEFGPIHPDGRVAMDQLDRSFRELETSTEISPHVYPVSKIVAEREQYLKVMTETQKSHLLLSSSVLDIPADTKLFGRAGKDYEALVDSTSRKLEGTAVFGRNANFGYKTQGNAEKYMKKLEESVSHLPDPGKFEILERDGQFYVSWKFKREYDPLEHMAFGADVLSAHLFSKKIDITDFANGTIGREIFPAYMRMNPEIPAVGSAAAREEARVESVFLQEARNTFMRTKNPTELERSLRLGEEEGKSWTVKDIQTQHPHLSKAEAEKVHFEYAAYRRIVDHMYVMADRAFRKNLERKEMLSLYNKDGEFVTHATKPLDEVPDGVTRIWDLETQKVVEVNKNRPVVKLNAALREGDHIVEYAQMPSGWQHGPIRAGALTKVPGYIPRYYKEWFVVDKVPKALWINGEKVAEKNLRDHSEAVHMAGSKKELDAIVERFSKEDPTSNYVWRKEEKDINDKIIHDSRVYDTYLKQIHRRGDRLQALDRPAETEDVLVALTKAIRTTSKLTAWEDVNAVRRESFVKAYGDFTEGKFPDQINDIKPKRHMTPAEERKFLSAQSVYAQIEREQLSTLQSDIVWKNYMHSMADVLEKFSVDSKILREWGEKGVVPLRVLKSAGAQLLLYWKPLRMWVVQPQQFKELIAVSPSYAKHLAEIMPVTAGLLAKSNTLKTIRPTIEAASKRSIKDYDRIIAALEESGIRQAVDMNQMIHGIWKDAAEELAPKKISSTLEAVQKGASTVADVAAFPGKVFRSIGYNPAELMNQVSLWLYARQRWMEKNPGKNWDTPENRAQIARDQSLYAHMSSTRAGMFGWQEGLISAFTQFVAIPWKSTLQMISSHQFTGPEKARLAAARLFWYGKYGLPLGAGMYTLLESKLEDKEDRVALANWTTGATDRIWNTSLHVLFDTGNQNTSVDTKNLSTVIDGEYIWDVINGLVDLSHGDPVQMPKITFPYESATGSLFEAVRTIHDIFALNNAGPADLATWKAAAWKAVSFAGTLSDFNKAMLAEGMSKSGNGTGYEQTRGEAVARLFVLPPSEETMYNMVNKTQIERSREVKQTAKEIHQRLMAVMQAKSVDEQVKQKEYLDGLSSFLQTVPDYYKTEIINEVLKQDRMSWRDKKESLLLNLYRNAQDRNDSHYIEMRNALEKSTDPDIKALLADLESLKQPRME